PLPGSIPRRRAAARSFPVCLPSRRRRASRPSEYRRLRGFEDADLPRLERGETIDHRCSEPLIILAARPSPTSETSYGDVGFGRVVQTARLNGMCFVLGTAVVVSTLALWFLWLGPQPRVLIVGSTTTTQDTGLLDVLQGEYTRQTGRPLRIVVAGTGAILQQGRNGDLDVLLTHDRARELTFVAEQQGLWRKPVMYNWFVLVGPGIRRWNSSLSAEQLAQNAYAFLALLYEHRNEITCVSRGGGSGTYAKELALWAAAGVNASRSEERRV